MRLYASIRKSQHKLKSVKLNAIADRELKDKKVEYPEETNIATFPFIDWLKFILYNIKDVLLQLGIERKCKDVITYYMRSHQNMTPYNKIFKETHLLRNVREMYFNKEGWVQGNNLNIIGSDEEDTTFYNNEDEDDEMEISVDGEKVSYKGAINAEPKWNDHVGMPVNGIRSNNIFKNATDFDMGAFYPSIKIASNMDPGTLLYKAEFNNDEFISGEMPNKSLNTTYNEKDKNGNMRKLDITGEAVNTYVSGNILTMGYNYFNMPNMSDLLKIVEKELA
jgi:DNA polymerase elongation subunit (family B)